MPPTACGAPLRGCESLNTLDTPGVFMPARTVGDGSTLPAEVFGLRHLLKVKGADAIADPAGVVDL
jgi:hypothetical protein